MRQHLAGIFNQQTQKPVLDRRKMNFVVADKNLALQ